MFITTITVMDLLVSLVLGIQLIRMIITVSLVSFIIGVILICPIIKLFFRMSLTRNFLAHSIAPFCAKNILAVVLTVQG